MSAKTNTPLSQLLNYMHISAVNLATELHVDPSLVSRWKTGKRKFNSSSPHYRNLLNYIVDKDKHLEYQNIALFLNNYFPDLQIKDQKEAYNALSMYLNDNCSAYRNVRYSKLESNSLNSATVEILKGEKEKKEYLLYMLETALSLPERKKLFLMFDNCTDALFDNEGFYNLWIQKLKQLAKAKNDIFFIYNNTSSYPYIKNLEAFSSLCCEPSFHPYYTNRNFPIFFDLFILEDTFCLTNFVSSEKSEKNILYFFKHPDIVKTLHYEYSHYLSNCTPIFGISKNFDQIESLLTYLQYTPQKIFIYSSTPFCFPIPVEDFQKILEYNELNKQISYEAIQKYKDFFYKPFFKKSGNKTTILINADTLAESLFEPEHNFLPSLLLRSEEKIIIPKKYYKFFLKEFISYLENPEKSPLKISISMLEKENLILPRSNITYIADNFCTYFHSFASEKESKILFSSNALLANNIYSHLETINNDVSKGIDNTNYLLSLLKQLLLKVTI